MAYRRRRFRANERGDAGDYDRRQVSELRTEMVQHVRQIIVLAQVVAMVTGMVIIVAGGRERVRIVAVMRGDDTLRKSRREQRHQQYAEYGDHTTRGGTAGHERDAIWRLDALSIGRRSDSVDAICQHR